MKRFTFLLTSLATLLMPASSVFAEIDTAPIKQWIDRSAKIKTFQVEFKQLRYLKTVRKPLESAGKIEFAAPGSLRWQSGDPPTTIATMKPGGALTVQHVAKKEAEVMTREALEDKAGGQALAMLESGFPTSMDEFQKRFTVSEVQKVDGGYFRVSAQLAGGHNPVIRKVEFFIHEAGWTLGGLHFHFRDGSRIENTFTATKENVKLGENIFTPDLSGYTIKQ
jgi:hypothetical protein